MNESNQESIEVVYVGVDRHRIVVSRKGPQFSQDDWLDIFRAALVSAGYAPALAESLDFEDRPATMVLNDQARK